MSFSLFSPQTSNHTNWNCFEGHTYCGTLFWFIINALLTIVTVSGNLLTIFAILLSKKLSSFVANQFIFSLAVSDLFVGCSLPYHMAFYIIDDFGNNKTNCLLRFVAISFAFSSSICNLLFIALDRYIAIVYPLHYIRMVTRKSSLCVIAFGWVLSFTIASIPLLWNDYHEGIQCEMVVVVPTNYMKFIVVPMFVLIWTIMLLLYCRICREASGHVKRIKNANSAQNILALRDSKSFQVMLTILGYFTLFWLPYFVVSMLARMYREKNLATFYEVAFNLAVANSGMNPVIYAWKNHNFRQAFQKLLCCRSPDLPPSTQYITNHVPSKKNSISVNGVCGTIDSEKERQICEKVLKSVKEKNENGYDVKSEVEINSEIEMKEYSSDINPKNVMGNSLC